MQSLQILMAELETVKKRFRKNLELSDDSNLSLEHNADVRGREERLSILKPRKSDSMYERKETTSD